MIETTVFIKYWLLMEISRLLEGLGMDSVKSRIMTKSKC